MRKSKSVRPSRNPHGVAPVGRAAAAGAQNKGKINLGGRPANATQAWRALSQDAKLAFMEYRAQGKFGGTPGQAPYWGAQEFGEEAAGIEATHLIETAIKHWRAKVPRLIAEWLRS